MPGRTPTEFEVLGYFKSLSNWGRWGKEDQLGALNLITPRQDPAGHCHRAGGRHRLPGPHRAL